MVLVQPGQNCGQKLTVQVPGQRGEKVCTYLLKCGKKKRNSVLGGKYK